MTFSIFSGTFSAPSELEEEKQVFFIVLVMDCAREVELWREQFVGSRATITLFIGGSGDIENENRMADMGDRFVRI